MKKVFTEKQDLGRGEGEIRRDQQEQRPVCLSVTWARERKDRALDLRSPETACCPTFQVWLLSREQAQSLMREKSTRHTCGQELPFLLYRDVASHVT